MVNLALELKTTRILRAMYDSILNHIYEDFPHTFIYVGEKNIPEVGPCYTYLPLKGAKVKQG